VNAVHVPQLVLISRRVHVAVQQALQHVQECRIILGNLKFVLWLQPKGDCCALPPRRLVLLLLSRKRLRSIVHCSKAIAENCVETDEVIPVAVGVEQRVSLVLDGETNESQTNCQRIPRLRRFKSPRATETCELKLNSIDEMCWRWRNVNYAIAVRTSIFILLISVFTHPLLALHPVLLLRGHFDARATLFLPTQSIEARKSPRKCQPQSEVPLTSHHSSSDPAENVLSETRHVSFRCESEQEKQLRAKNKPEHIYFYAVFWPVGDSRAATKSQTCFDFSSFLSLSFSPHLARLFFLHKNIGAM
jgi:hypothetical protein